MKIRNGFVSNSSSSSFIVVFPKKPKNAEEVFEYMFSGKDKNDTLEHYGTSLTYNEIANKVYDHIFENNKNMTKELASLFSIGYNKYTIKYSISKNLKNNALINKLMRLYNIEENVYEEYLKKVSEYDKNNAPKPVRYAYSGGIDPKTNKEYTARDIGNYEKYIKDYKKSRETLEYRAIEKWRNDSRIPYKDIRALQDELGAIEAKAFIKKHNGKYIFVVSYSDSDSVGSLMEHGDIFYNLYHEIISHH